MGRAFEYRRKSKEKRWGKMSTLFPKLAKSITMAAKEGGQDPDSNSKLRLAIVNAKAENMPKDNIAAAIKRASGKDVADISEMVYEAKAPHGVMAIIEAATDNTNRTVVNLRTFFNKAGGQLVDSGSLQFFFSRKAMIEFQIPEGEDPEEIELELIDHGLEELEIVDGVGYAIGDFADFGKLTAGAEKLGLELTKASLERIPSSTVELTAEQVEEIEQLLDKVEDDEDVQAVFTNIA
ncbi:MAG: YebC/PmpR family DNA-binding regulatory protein [Verrucomicrobiales bacterium]|jgi:YebC/PmpR family DNA-binding regulatory protein